MFPHGFLQLLTGAILLGALALAVVLGLILAYHWYRFALNPRAATIASIVYSVGCIVIFAFIAGNAFSSPTPPF
jgi:O-antigen ligase